MANPQKENGCSHCGNHSDGCVLCGLFWISDHTDGWLLENRTGCDPLCVFRWHDFRVHRKNKRNKER